MTGATPGGPFFDDLHVGLRHVTAPAVTLAPGHAALHQAILGDRTRLALDARLGLAVTSETGSLADPALVWDIAIGQSTALTQRVKANLFYRGLAFRRLPRIGDTLQTVTEVVALRQNRSRPGRAATGMAVLRIQTLDQLGRTILDFWRCAMLPLSTADALTECDDSFDAIPSELPATAATDAIVGWDLRPLAGFSDPDQQFAALTSKRRWTATDGDVVSSV